MKVKVHDIEIECPDKPWMVALVQAMNPMQAWTLNRLQQQPKNWPGHTNIPEYCIYMGSGETSDGKVDFYHYEPSPASYSEYSTAIVFGDFGGDYRSGWPELAAKHDYYQEQLKREFRCGFLTMDDLVRVGIAALGVGREPSDSIRLPRKTFRLGPEPIGVEDEPSVSEPESIKLVTRCSGTSSYPEYDDDLIARPQEPGWSAWFACFFALFFMSVACGATALVWWNFGWIDWGTWGLGFVGLTGVLTAGWWIARGQKYRRTV